MHHYLIITFPLVVWLTRILIKDLFLNLRLKHHSVPHKHYKWKKKIIFPLKLFDKNSTDLKLISLVIEGFMLHAPSPTKAAIQITASAQSKYFFK